jgi:hypothetical protein
MTIPDLMRQRARLKEKLAHTFSPSRRKVLEGEIKALTDAIEREEIEREERQGRLL